MDEVYAIWLDRVSEGFVLHSLCVSPGVAQRRAEDFMREYPRADWRPCNDVQDAVSHTRAVVRGLGRICQAWQAQCFGPSSKQVSSVLIALVKVEQGEIVARLGDLTL